MQLTCSEAVGDELFVNRDDPKTAPASLYVQYTTLGLQYAFGIGAAVWLGHWLDQKYDWSPVGTLVGAAFGFTSSTVWLYRKVYASPPKGQDRDTT